MSDTARPAGSTASAAAGLLARSVRALRNPSRLLTRFYSFLGVGLAGMVVDGAIFFTALALGAHFLASRLLASLVSITATWLLNRFLTFNEGRLASLLPEYVRYLLASSVGAFTNAAVSFPVSLIDAAYLHLPAYAAGAAAGLMLNFILYDNVVFTGRRDEDKMSRNA
jgi:putative flippase GtrA